MALVALRRHLRSRGEKLRRGLTAKIGLGLVLLTLHPADASVELPRLAEIPYRCDARCFLSDSCPVPLIPVLEETASRLLFNCWDCFIALLAADFLGREAKSLRSFYPSPTPFSDRLTIRTILTRYWSNLDCLSAHASPSSPRRLQIDDARKNSLRERSRWLWIRS